MGGRVSYLGEFEQVVMLAVARLRADAYGMAIRQELVERAGRSASIGAVYATLDRLVSKGYLRARDDELGGRARRFMSLTREGVAALDCARELQARMWAGVQLPRPGGKA